MSQLRICITDPEVRTIERPGVIWILSGVGESADQRLEEQGDVGGGFESDVCRRMGDASVLKIRFANGRPATLEAWKGLTSHYDVFYAARPSGDLLVSNQFRNLLAQLPPSERYPSEHAVVDHFLFRTVPGTSSYCRHIKRVGQGEKLVIDLASGDNETSLFDRIEDQSERRSITHHIEQIECALGSVLNPLRTEDGTANLFSGGVDSTLIQTYLGSSVPPLTMVPDTPEFRFETEYAARATQLLGLRPQWHGVKEADYPDQLDKTIDALGMPPHHESEVLVREAFQHGFRKFITGQGADGLFGIGGRTLGVAQLFSSPLGAPPLGRRCQSSRHWRAGASKNLLSPPTA